MKSNLFLRVLIPILIVSHLFAEETLQEKIQAERVLQAQRIERALKNADKIEDINEREALKAGLKRMKPDLSKPVSKTSIYQTRSMKDNLGQAVFEIPLAKISELRFADEIRKRPQEFKEAVENMLAKEELVVEEMHNLPHWAKYISDEYQIEIVERVIFHPSAGRYGGVKTLLQGYYFEPYFDSAPENRKIIMDKLVALGEFEADSEFYTWWIEGDKKDGNLSKSTLPNSEDPEQSKNVEREPKPLPESSSEETDKPASFPWWLLGIVGLIVVLGFMLLKGRSK